VFLLVADEQDPVTVSPEIVLETLTHPFAPVVTAAYMSPEGQDLPVHDRLGVTLARRG